MKKKLAISTFAFILANGLYAETDSPPPDVLRVAKEDFTEYLTNAVTEETKTLVGFHSGDNLSAATLGAPFRLFTLSAQSIKNYNGTSPLKSILTGADMWYFPIMIEDAIKMVMYVGKKDGAWMRAGLGSAGLARHMQDIATRWPLKEGYKPIFVQQHDIGKYLFSIPQVGMFNLTRTGAAPTGKGLGKKGSPLKPLAETIKQLQSELYDN